MNINLKPSLKSLQCQIFYLILRHYKFEQKYVTKLYYYIFFIFDSLKLKHISYIYYFMNLILISVIIIDIPYIHFIYSNYQNLQLYTYGAYILSIQFILYTLCYIYINIFFQKQINNINIHFNNLILKGI